ncbi:MAG: sialate O-acetylesterase [Candidatus Brocadiia bacterium]
MGRCVAAFVILLGLLAGSVGAEVELPSIIGDAMVLQRGTEAALWGWDEPGTTVTVTFRGSEVTTRAGDDGKWMTRVSTGEAGGPFELRISGTDERTLSNVMVGEVWVAGGQSNMWWFVRNCVDAEQEIAAADYPEIRFWDANTGPREAGWIADSPQRTVETEWQVTSPQTVGNFAGVAYFFARDLHEELDVPVGIVHLAVPGSPIEPFLSEEFAHAHLPQQMQNLEYRRRDYPEALKRHEQALAEWEKAREAAEREGREPPRKPRAPRNPEEARGPGTFFNGMVWPAHPFTTRGFLWYQGESNAGRSLQYSVLFPSLIEEWRELWGDPDAPFLFVELAEFLEEQTRPVEDATWPALRDAQHAALDLDNCYMVSSIDVFREGENVRNIHPPNKQLVARRLFLTALANVYGREGVVWSGPLYRSAEFKGGEVVIHFDHVGGGLTAHGDELRGFALAGPDRVFHWAEAEIRGDAVVLTSDEVDAPVAARYGWANNPIGNLYNEEGLPAFPFRTDHWVLTVGKREWDVPEDE